MAERKTNGFGCQKYFLFSLDELFFFFFFLIFQKPNRISRKVYRQNFKDKVYLQRDFDESLFHRDEYE